jgi:hypothetical protein
MKETHKSMESYEASFALNNSFLYYPRLSTYVQLKLLVESSLSLNYPRIFLSLSGEG